jgi:hypothetical protein
VYDVNALPADDFREDVVDIVAVVVINTPKDRNEVIQQRQEKNRHEEPAERTQRMQWPDKSELLLAERVRHVENIQDDQYDER